MAFLDDLKNNAKSNSNDNALRAELRKNLHVVAEEWSDMILNAVKNNIKEKATAGEFELQDGKRFLEGETLWHDYMYRNEYDSFSMAYFKENRDLFNILKRMRAANIVIDDKCFTNRAHVGEHSLVCKPKWKTYAFKSLSIWQLLLGVLTCGIYFSLIGELEFDNLVVEVSELLKKKMKKENIIFESFNIIPSHRDIFWRKKYKVEKLNEPIKVRWYKILHKGDTVDVYLHVSYKVIF